MPPKTTNNSINKGQTKEGYVNNVAPLASVRKYNSQQIDPLFVSCYNLFYYFPLEN